MSQAKGYILRNRSSATCDPRFAKLTLQEFVYWLEADTVYYGLTERQKFTIEAPEAQDAWTLGGANWTAESVVIPMKTGKREEQLELKRPPSEPM